MSEEESENILVENIGGYVVKVGRYFVASYKRSLIRMGIKYPDMLTDRLYKVKDILYRIDTAKEVAKELNGKVYQICVEPVKK